MNRARNIYIIAPGDTLSGISAATGVSVDKLAYVNGIADVNLIYAGSALEIPVSLHTFVANQRPAIWLGVALFLFKNQHQHSSLSDRNCVIALIYNLLNGS